MGKSKKSKKYSNKFRDNNCIPNTSQNDNCTDVRTIITDMSSIEDGRRLNACLMLANIFSTSTVNQEVYNRMTTPDILSKLNLRLVDHNTSVRFHAAGALRNIAANCQEGPVKRILDLGLASTAVTLVIQEIHTINNATNTSNLPLIERLVEAICNICAVSERAVTEAVAKGIVPVLIHLLDTLSSTSSSTSTLLVVVSNTLLVLTDGNTNTCEQILFMASPSSPSQHKEKVGKGGVGYGMLVLYRLITPPATAGLSSSSSSPGQLESGHPPVSSSPLPMSMSMSGVYCAGVLVNIFISMSTTVLSTSSSSSSTSMSISEKYGMIVMVVVQLVHTISSLSISLSLSMENKPQ
eukprot:gene11668-24438_t